MGVDLEAALGQADLFSGVDRRHLRKLARKMRTVRYASGDEIMVAGGPGMHGGLGSMGVVLQGSLQVRHPDGTVFAHIKPGEVFGEMALLDDQPRSATLTADEPTEVALLSAAEFREELKDNQAFTLNLVRILAQRLREARAEQREIRGHETGDRTSP
jgi:CRP/FNR family transcriptional regulator